MNEIETQLIQTGFNIDRLHEDKKINNEAYTILKDRNKQAINMTKNIVEGIPPFGTKEFNEMCREFFGGIKSNETKQSKN